MDVSLMFCCESEPLLLSHHPVYQKYVCCYCVHTMLDPVTYPNYPEFPLLPKSYHSHTDSRSLSYFKRNNKLFL